MGVEGDWLPLAARTKHHRLSGLTQYKLLIQKFWKSEVQNVSYVAKIKVSSSLFLLEALGENLLLCLFQLLEASHNSL